MSDDERRASVHHLVQRPLHQGLAIGVERAGGFIEQQDGRLAQHGTRNGDALTLARRERHAALPEHRVVALRQFFDEIIGEGRFRCLHDFVPAGTLRAIGDVGGNGIGEQRRLLRHHGEARSKCVEIGLVDGNAINLDPA